MRVSSPSLPSGLRSCDWKWARCQEPPETSLGTLVGRSTCEEAELFTWWFPRVRGSWIVLCIYYVYMYIYILYIITCVHIHICRDICIYVYTYFLKLPHSFSLIRPGVCWAWLVSQRVVALSLCKLENQPPKTG